MQQIESSVELKLNKVAKLLDEILVEIKKEEVAISPSLRKKLVSRWKAIESGRVKIHHFNSLKEFDKALG